MRITEYNKETSRAMFHQQGYGEEFDKGVAVGEAKDKAKDKAKGEAGGEERGLVRGIAELVKKGVVALWKALVWTIKGLVWTVREWLDWI